MFMPCFVQTSELPDVLEGAVYRPPQITWKAIIESHQPRKGASTYAQKIAALQSANEADIKMTLHRELSIPGGRLCSAHSQLGAGEKHRR